MKKIFFPILIICILSIFCSCSSKTVENKLIKGTSQDDLIQGINPLLDSDSWSTFENGLFFGSNNTLKAYNYDTQKSYILCGNSNCKHQNEDCPAWLNPNYSISGASIYNGKVYYFLNDMVSIKFYCQNITGDQQRVLWKQNLTNVEVGTYTFSGINRAIYHHGYVWVEFQYSALLDKTGDNISYTSTISGINLSNGKLIEVTTLQKKVTSLHTDTNYFSEIAYAGDGVIITDSISSSTQKEKRLESFMLYDIDTLSSKTIYKAEQIPIINENEIVGYVPEIEFFGRYGKSFVCTKNNNDTVNNNRNNKTLFLFDIETKSFETLIDKVYGFPFFEARHCMKSLINDSKFLYGILQNDNSTVNLYYYDLETKNSKLIFQDSKKMKYRLFDQTKTQFIIRIYNDNLIGDDFKTYLILKEDYLQGNLNKKHQISVK